MIELSTDVRTAISCRNGELIVKRTQDVEPILDHNKRMQADEVGGWRRNANKNMRKVAEIPNIVVEAWLREGFNPFRCTETELRKKLDDPNWSYLKTINGKLGKRSRHV